MGSISSSILSTWVSWLGIGKKKSERVKLLFCQSLHLCWWWSRWSRWWRWLIIVTHHLVPLLLALRGQDRGADCAWALALHICSYFRFFEFALFKQIGCDYFLNKKQFSPTDLPLAAEQVGEPDKKVGGGGRDTFSFFSLVLLCTTSISPPPSSLFFTSNEPACSAFWKWQKATCTLFLRYPRIPLRLWSEFLTWFGVNMKLFDSCSGAARSWWKDRDIKANTLAKEYL